MKKPHKPHKRRVPPAPGHTPGEGREQDERRGSEQRAPRPARETRPEKDARVDRNGARQRDAGSAARREGTPPIPRIVQERWSGAPSFREEAVDSDEPSRFGSAAHIHGVKPVVEALRAGARPLERILVSETAHDSRLREINELARTNGVPLRRVRREEIDRFVGAEVNHQGVVALTAAARYRDADELLETLAAKNGTTNPPLVVVLDGVEDPRNLGAIIRTVECSGAHGVFIPERRAAGLTDVVAKTAAGALEYVPVARARNTVELLARMKERGIWTVGTAADAEMNYTAWDWREPSALVLGGEGAGLRRLVRERCDALVRIPLLGRIESLNVSVAAAVVLYEAVRQRTVV